MWAPLDLDNRLDDRDGRSLRVFARLKPGATQTQAQAEMDIIAARLAKQYPNTNAKLGISIQPLQEKVVGSVRPTLLALLGTVGFVLLIACATVGNLMLSRSVGRRREMALRLAVGARSADLVRITMTEVLVLATLGAVGGLLLGSSSMQILNRMLPTGSIPRQTELAFDGPALAFGLVAALISAILAGILPSIEATRANLNIHLRSGRGSTHGAGQLRSQSALIALEVAVSLLLMTGAGLMMRTMLALTSVDAGFNSQDLLTMQVSIRGTDYDRNARRVNVFRTLRDHLAANPQVESVSAINHLPLGGDTWGLNYTIEGRPKPMPGQYQSALYRVIMPGYLRTMQIHLLEGRDFSGHDNEHTQQVAIINETLAKRQFRGIRSTKSFILA
jgi:putative ABC transport system permease protein